MLLIIEDSIKHQMAAKIQLPQANVVNYDEAYEILHDARPGDISGIITDLHFRIEESRVIPNAPFAAVYPKNLDAIGKELPFGLAFVLKGVELRTPVALYSDIDHHSDLVTGLLDMFGHGGYYRSRESGEKDIIPDPRFHPLCDCSCRMAEDMHWDGEKILLEPMPPSPAWINDEAERNRVFRAHWAKRVKDWRVAFAALPTLS